jgi:hypothetical protein
MDNGLSDRRMLANPHCTRLEGAKVIGLDFGLAFVTSDEAEVPCALANGLAGGAITAR